MNNEEGNIDELVDYLIYNYEKINLEILDKDNDYYIMNNQDLFNFLTEIFLKILEKKFGIYDLEELNNYQFTEGSIEFLKNKFLQLGIKISLISSNNTTNFDNLPDNLPNNLPDLEDEPEYVEDKNDNKNLEDYKFFFKNNGVNFQLGFNHFY